MTSQPGTIGELANLAETGTGHFRPVKVSPELLASSYEDSLGLGPPARVSTGELATKASPWGSRSSLQTQLRLVPQRLAAIVAFLILWELAPTVGFVDRAFIPPPSIVFSKLWEFTISGTLPRHALASLQRALSGYTLAILTAVPVGFAVGWSKDVEKYLDPLLQTLRQMPILALFPVFILFLGIGEQSKAAMVALACFWSIFLNTVSGVMSVDPLLVKAARAMNVSPFSMFYKVVLPAAVPSMFTGFRYAGTVALLVLVSVEMIGAERGLGYWVMNAEQRFSTPEMFAGIATLTVLGVIINYTLELLERRMTRWKEKVVRR